MIYDTRKIIAVKVVKIPPHIPPSRCQDIILKLRLVSAYKTSERFGITRAQSNYFFYTVAVDTIETLSLFLVLVLFRDTR